jgi:hypothetical protein
MPMDCHSKASALALTELLDVFSHRFQFFDSDNLESVYYAILDGLFYFGHLARLSYLVQHFLWSVKNHVLEMPEQVKPRDVRQIN